MFHYHNKIFRPLQNSANGETSAQTTFVYRQEGSIISANYAGGQIIKGQLLGWVDEAGNIEMRYQQINAQGQLRTGKCFSKPEILENGKIRLHESWEWTSEPYSKGTSIIEEI